MTPLAHSLARRLADNVLPPFWVHNRDNLIRDLEDIHCFEISNALSTINTIIETSKGYALAELSSTFGFLPSPKTWIEWRDPSGERLAILLEDMGDNDISYGLFIGENSYFYAGHCNFSISRYAAPDDEGWKNLVDASFIAVFNNDYNEMLRAVCERATMACILINSPKIIGRRQHMPHAGLERRLTRSFGVGRFPLHAYTEILLKVSKPPEIDDGEPHEAHLTGRRALHFCRKHIRIRLGKLEYVSAHWRGDPALGIKQSRYKVSP